MALCSELDIVSQGNTIEEARDNLVKARELFFKAADPKEIRRNSCQGINNFRQIHRQYEPGSIYFAASELGIT